MLIRATAELLRRDPGRKLRVIICGGASGAAATERQYMALAEELGVSRRVRFLDPRPPEELVTIYQAADLVAVPSYNESFGLVAMEAQACGTPVIAARVGGLPVAVAEGETGLLVDGHDTNDWADAIEQLLDDDDTRLRMAGEAVAHAAHFSWSASASQLASVYSEALSIDVDECPPRRERADGQR